MSLQLRFLAKGLNIEYLIEYLMCSICFEHSIMSDVFKHREGSLLDVDRHIERRKKVRQQKAAYWMLIGISRKERRSDMGGQPIGC